MNELFNNAVADFDYLNKVFIESTAQVAYNATIFEAALSDEVLTEADEVVKVEEPAAAGEDKKGGSVKAAAYKALQTLRSFAVSVLNKIKAAINEAIAKASQNSFDKFMAEYEKVNKFDARWAKVTPAKNIELADPEKIFLSCYSKTFLDFIAASGDASKVKAFETVAKTVAGALPANYAEAAKALNGADKASAVSKVLGNLVSFAEKNEIEKDANEFLKSVPNLKETTNAAKTAYKQTTNDINSIIKDLKAQIAGATDDKIADIKNKISFMSEALSIVHAGYIGYLKWAVASNMQAIKAVRSAKKAAKQEVKESVMGLALL